MGLFEPERTNSAPHPRKEPRFPEPLSRENLKKVFEGCVDYMERTVYLHGDRKRTVTVCYLLGMARNERLSDYVLRPLAQDPALSQVPEEELFARLQYGALYNLAANRRTTLDDVVNDLILGSCALFFPGQRDALTLPVVTEEKRSVGEPENEPAWTCSIWTASPTRTRWSGCAGDWTTWTSTEWRRPGTLRSIWWTT